MVRIWTRLRARYVSWRYFQDPRNAPPDAVEQLRLRVISGDWDSPRVRPKGADQ